MPFLMFHIQVYLHNNKIGGKLDCLVTRNNNFVFQKALAYCKFHLSVSAELAIFIVSKAGESTLQQNFW
jgi:hypothetical protein